MRWVRNLCRLCGQIGDICYNIFDPNSGLHEKIKKCLNLQISEEDFKPKEICHFCCIKVNEFLQFIDLCISTSMKFESVCYSDASLAHSHKKQQNRDCSNKQSVIVSNRQNTDQKLHKNSTIVILENCTLGQPDVIEFNVNYDNVQQTELFSNSNIPVKAGNEIKIISEGIVEQTGVPNEKTEQQCIVSSANLHNNLLERLKNEVSGNIAEDCTQSKCITVHTHHEQKSKVDTSTSIKTNYKSKVKKKQLISVDDVKKSLETHYFPTIVQNFKLRKEKLYPCPHCERTFKQRTNLAAHISVHTNVKSYKCSNCPKAFAVKCHLTQHNKTHSELFKCQICHKSFQVPSKLSRHMQTHSTNKPYVCSFTNCTKAFSDKQNLKHHIFSHTSVRNISCNICDKLFKSRKSLNAHIKIHVSDKTYQCTYCEKNFRSKPNLRRHVIKHSS